MLILIFVSIIGHEILLVDPVAQRAGMGYALSSDGYCVHYNPAGLCISTERHYSASYMNYIANTHFGYLGYESNQVGVGIGYFNSGSIKKTDALGNEYGSFTVSSIDLNCGKGFFFNDLGLGVALKLIYENIDTLFSFGAGADIGALYFFPDYNIQAGIAVKHLGATVKPFHEQREILPCEIDLGVAKRYDRGWIGLDLVRPALVDFGIRFGSEQALNDYFSLKGSYSTLFSAMRTDNGADILTGIMIGFSVRTNTLRIDYAYSPFFDLGNSHRVSVSIGG